MLFYFCQMLTLFQYTLFVHNASSFAKDTQVKITSKKHTVLCKWISLAKHRNSIELWNGLKINVWNWCTGQKPHYLSCTSGVLPNVKRLKAILKQSRNINILRRQTKWAFKSNDVPATKCTLPSCARGEQRPNRKQWCWGMGGAGGGRGKVSFPGNQFRTIIQNPCSFSFPAYYQKQTMCLRFINRDWCLGVFRVLWESRGSFSFGRILTLILCLRGITLLRFRQTIGVLLLLLRWVF